MCYFPGGLVVDSGGFVAVGKVGQDHDIDMLIMASEVSSTWKGCLKGSFLCSDWAHSVGGQCSEL